jgi:hypothetical protein
MPSPASAAFDGIARDVARFSSERQEVKNVLYGELSPSQPSINVLERWRVFLYARIAL